MTRLFKDGDIVKVYSLQSFHGGGFINGREGIVSQGQLKKGGSIFVAVERIMVDVGNKIDPSYEVYPQQLELVTKVEDIKLGLIDEFYNLLKRIRLNIFH